MFKVIRKSEAKERIVDHNKIARNFVTKDISPHVSLAVIEAQNYDGKIKADYNWIYFVLEGEMVLQFGNEEQRLMPGDTCYVQKEEQYQMIGSFKTIVVSQPAFGVQDDGHANHHSANAFCGYAGLEEMRHLDDLIAELTDIELKQLVENVGIFFGGGTLDREDYEGVIDEADRENFYREYRKIIETREKKKTQ